MKSRKRLERSHETTLIKPLLRNISRYRKEGKQLVVLLSTGAYNPPHMMHVGMFKKAKEQLEKNQMIVIGCFISPSHDVYLQHKYSNSDQIVIPARYRAEILDIIIKKEGMEDWIFVDHWESSCRSFVDHTSVLKSLHEYIMKNVKVYEKEDFSDAKIRTCYLAGKDLFLRCRGHMWLQKPDLGVVVVERSETARVASMYHRQVYQKFKKSKGPHLFFVGSEGDNEEMDFSSTKLRKYVENGRFEEIPESFLCKEAVEYIRKNMKRWKRK